MTGDILFYCGLALLFTHELDAIHRHEWRMFPVVSNLEENTAYLAFIILHIPLFVLLLWLASHPSESVRIGFQVVIDIFLMVHLGLHILLKKHEKNEFANRLSQTLIIAAALVGGIHLCLVIL